jgi:hypothetical protein
MKPEGPSLGRWLVGRVLHPPSRARCSKCGGPGADDKAAADLPPALAALALLCPTCRRSERDRRLGRRL